MDDLYIFNRCQSSGSSSDGTTRYLGDLAEKSLLIKRKDLGVSALISIIKRKSVKTVNNFSEKSKPWNPYITNLFDGSNLLRQPGHNSAREVTQRGHANALLVYSASASRSSVS
jgi:hypothetical protein